MPKAIREFDLIRALARQYNAGHPSILCGIGDDAAVISPPSNRWELFTTDLLTEGIHFDLKTVAFPDIGFRAAAANLSDIAAMGGAPEYLLVSLAIPPKGTDRQVHQLYHGMMAACRPHKVRLIGGDTSASTGTWFINITLIGSIATRRALLRGGAKPGDDLYVTGTLGDSLAGLQLLRDRRRKTAGPTLSAAHRRFLERRHLRPTARISEGRWLVQLGWVTSSIDISDGLSGDLRHICEESGAGAEVRVSSLPISSACRSYAESTGQEAGTLALTGGEDYELLFTIPARFRVRFERLAARRSARITRIGAITPVRQSICIVTPDGRRRPMPNLSYEHFGPIH